MSATLNLTLSLIVFGGELAGHALRAILVRTTKTGRIDRALMRLAAAKAIRMEANTPVDGRIIRLTDEGRRSALGGVDPAAAWARSWDGLWRVVAFDIPESETARRARLRRRLHEFRFGWLQNSVWLSPDPLDEFRAGLGASDIEPASLTCFEAHCVGGESPAALVKAAWDLEGLNRSYADYERILQAHPSPATGTPAAWLRWLQAENRAWRLVARRDPFLPEVLLPVGYRGRTAWNARAAALAVCARSWL